MMNRFVKKTSKLQLRYFHHQRSVRTDRRILIRQHPSEGQSHVSQYVYDGLVFVVHRRP